VEFGLCSLEVMERITTKFIIMENKILKEDLQYIFQGLSSQEKAKLSDATILITGCAGFLGYYFMRFFTEYAEPLKIKKIIGLDNFMLGRPEWIDTLEKNPIVSIRAFDIIKDDISGYEKADFVIHMASIASPVFYRKYPIQTLDANIWGLRRLLDFYLDKEIKGMLFFSSSEIYGDPDPENIPTDENYRGNVAVAGPRACYDEAKRFGETLCYLYAQEYQFPVRVARPFNNYGPGMNLNDKRVPADFAKAVFRHEDIVIFSDGKPTRTFCYISDAITGYLKILLYHTYDYFNIGIEKPEISVRELAEIYREAGKEIFNYQGHVLLHPPAESAYLVDNPNRRCPKIDKARSKLNYAPSIEVEEGVRRFLEFIKIYKGELR
jgi:UDP-glucuronate decarboxylase